jgi:hypothetical protein
MVCGGEGVAGTAAAADWVGAGVIGGASAVAGVVGFLALVAFVVLVDLGGGAFGVAWAWTRLRHDVLADVLFRVLQ